MFVAADLLFDVVKPCTKLQGPSSLVNRPTPKKREVYGD